MTILLNDKDKIKVSSLLIFTLVLLKWGVLPWLDWRSELISEIAFDKSNYRTPELIKSNLEKISEGNLYFNNEYEKFDRLFFQADSGEALSLLLRQYIEKVATSHDVNFERSNNIGNSQIGGLLKTSIQLTFNAPQKETISFLKDLEKGDKRVSFERLLVRQNGLLMTTTIAVSGWAKVVEVSSE